MIFTVGDNVKVDGYSGIAFTVVGFTEDKVVVVMVGDDTKHYVDTSDLSPLSSNEFCPTCGQIGCNHY